MTWHSWTECYVPSFGWLQWDGKVPAFTSPVYWCVGLYTYHRPQASLTGVGEDIGDPSTLDLWNTQGMFQIRVTWLTSDP